ncbi:armadillo-type protein [Sporodiniella umbellata]|nr:armadillo-type protein [Sporodiniella umbellata]
MQSSPIVSVDIKPPSPGPSSPPQHRLLNRVSTLFGAKKKTTASTDLLQEPLGSQIDSLYDMDDAASRVDSMYSSIHSRRSSHRPPAANPSTPAPLRTVQLENPIVHLTTPPTPPPNEALSKKPPTPPNCSQKETEIDEQFQLLLKEYAPSADHMSSVNNLTSEQKEILLRSSRSPALLKKNSTFSSFSIKATLGLKNKSLKQSHHHSTLDGDLPSIFHSDGSQMGKAKTTPGRYSRTRTPLYSSGSSSNEQSTCRRSKVKSTPEYFVHLLQMTHVRDLEDAEVLDLRVFLRSVVVSWTSEFLSLGGYEAMTQLFQQMKEAPKRRSNDDRILQHLGKCLKAIMTHQPMGTQLVLLNPAALLHVRDILFGPANKKQKQVYGLEITTRSLLLNLLCTLATLQTHCSANVEYIHGYDVLRRLLLDRPTDRLLDKKNQAKQSPPFPMTLKTDPQEILQMIMENDPNGQAIGKEYEWSLGELKPRYTAWMRELQYTVEQHIETITFLSQVLNYDFKSAYRQLKSRNNGTEDESTEEASGSVMTDEGVVDYIVTHLRLIRTVVTTPPTSYVGCYDEREQEKIRLELMMSGFDKISKILIQCPHPTVRESYINYLRPLMSPCADLTKESSSRTPPPLPDRSKQYKDLDQLNPHDEDDDFEVYVYADDAPAEDLDHEPTTIVNRQWRYDDEPYDDIFYSEESFEEDDEEEEHLS